MGGEKTKEGSKLSRDDWQLRMKGRGEGKKWDQGGITAANAWFPTEFRRKQESRERVPPTRRRHSRCLWGEEKHPRGGMNAVNSSGVSSCLIKESKKGRTGGRGQSEGAVNQCRFC